MKKKFLFIKKQTNYLQLRGLSVKVSSRFLAAVLAESGRWSGHWYSEHDNDRIWTTQHLLFMCWGFGISIPRQTWIVLPFSIEFVKSSMVTCFDGCMANNNYNVHWQYYLPATYSQECAVDDNKLNRMYNREEAIAFLWLEECSRDLVNFVQVHHLPVPVVHVQDLHKRNMNNG